MADRQALIDWPLTPYTGWGGYGIQLAQALLEQRQYWPRLLACNDRSSFCDLHWLDALQHPLQSGLELAGLTPAVGLGGCCERGQAREVESPAYWERNAGEERVRRAQEDIHERGEQLYQELLQETS